MRYLPRAAVVQSLSWMLACGWTAQTLAQVAVGGAVMGLPSTDVARVETNLPDSPGMVLRRRMESGTVGEVSGSDADADSPQAIADKKAAASAAKASDRRSTVSCGSVVDPAKASRGAGTEATPGRTAMNGAGQGATRNEVTGSTSTSIATASVVATGGAANSNLNGVVTSSTQPCSAAPNPYQRFLNSTTPIPLTVKQKGYLAVHNFIDPGNIITILGTSAIAIGSDSHTAYGPGMKGFGENAGLSFVQDATGDFFGTFLIPSIAHEDPHYHRRPEASIPRRVVHAISRTVIAQGDDGHPMPNYATLLTYPITAEIANLYVPGVASNGPSTVERVLTGYATDPIDNLITEFLPDVAKRVHVRVIFVQQIINQVAAGQPVSMF